MGNDFKGLPRLENLPGSIALRAGSKGIPRTRIFGMLALRSALSFSLLLLLAYVFYLAGEKDPVTISAAWWLWFITVTNLVCLFLLYRFSQLEGLKLSDIFYLNRSTWKGDLRWTLIAFLGMAPLALPPGILLAQALWGDPLYPNTLLIQPVPKAAVYPLFLLMPVSQALAELPVYWGYVAPRLRALGLNRVVVILVVGSVLSLQHMFFSFQPDWKYCLWLAVKFFPFALWTGFIVDRRPTALPYLMGLHFLMDATLPYLVLIA